MSVESYRVAICARGWKHAAWQDDFYPEDLPQDWLLGYYANEFPVVYVPASDWLGQKEIAAWTEDINDAFRFILEMPAAHLLDDSLFSTALACAASLGEYCLGIVFIMDDELAENVGLVETRLDAALQVTTVCVDDRDVELVAELEKLLLSKDISKVRTAAAKTNQAKDEPALSRGKLAISHVSGEIKDAAVIRQELEYLLAASTPERVCILCFGGEPPSLELMRNADIILNLL